MTGDSIPEISRPGRRNEAETLEVLFEISQALTDTRNPDELYRAIHLSLARILNVDNFYIALHHPERDSISFPYHVDEKDEIPDEIFNFSETASLTGKVIDSRTPLIFYEQDIVEFARKKDRNIIGSLSKIWLGAPLMIRDSVIGVIAIQSFRSPHDYRETDLDLLNTVSQHIALAIERKESEEKLKSQQQVLESILETSPVGICQVENRVFKWVNARMVEMFGYKDKGEMTNQNASMVYESPEAYREAGRIIRDGLEKSGKVDFDFYLQGRNQHPFKAQIIMTTTSSDDPMAGVIAIIADISQRELARKEKMEKERLQGVLEMAGAVCHEINQPLQAIMGYASLFEPPETATTGEIKKIKHQASRIGDITKRLTRITRYKTISYPGDTQIVDIWGSSDDKSS